MSNSLEKAETKATVSGKLSANVIYCFVIVRDWDIYWSSFVYSLKECSKVKGQQTLGGDYPRYTLFVRGERALH